MGSAAVEAGREAGEKRGRKEPGIVRLAIAGFLPLAMGLMACMLAPAALANRFERDLVAAALYRTTQSVTYDGRYFSIPYPNGDVPAHLGVCTDVVIRAYRALGEDLQQRVHEDMAANFSLYPSRRIWGLTRPDRHIDHRRVPNLQTFFRRFGETLPLTQNPDDYRPGDLVTWMLPGNLPHIGIVVDQVVAGEGRPWIVHNIGAGPKLEDRLFAYPITGHYRYVPATYRLALVD